MSANRLKSQNDFKNSFTKDQELKKKDNNRLNLELNDEDK